MGFLKDLNNTFSKVANGLNNSLSVGENGSTSLHAKKDGKITKHYDKLGDYANRIDRTEERKYYEEGYLRTDPYGARTKQYQILMQQPTATLLVKKRMFSSIAENYKTEYMDKDEKLFFRAMRILFQNKCNQVAALEGLSKVQKITESVGDVSKEMVSIVLGIYDGAGQGTLFGGISNEETESFKNTLDKLRKIYFFNEPSKLTNWITDNSNIFSTKFGGGTGVIEITNFSSFNTTNTLSLKNSGGAQFTIEDPYNAMVINEYDIEKALNDATNIFKNSSFVQFGKESSDELIENSTVLLNKLRAERGVGNITFHISNDTIVGRRVIATIDSEGVDIPFKYDPGFGGINNLFSSPSKVVDVAPEYLINGAAAGISGLNTKTQRIYPTGNDFVKIYKSESELTLFRTIIQNTYNNIQLVNNIDGDLLQSNKNTNYARKKMRFMFLGKSIIQPMDSVHFYIKSKSRYDNRLITGMNNMFSGSNVLENLNKTVSDFKSSLNSVSAMFGGSGGVEFNAEKNMYVGPEFPSWLWNSVRSQFLNEKEGAHIFAGLVSGANTSCNNGMYQVNITADDNSAYFKKGKVNFKPGADVFNGSLFDPLTPFKSKFDAVNSNIKAGQLELLDENVELLGTSTDEAPLLKHKSGPQAGQMATQENLLQERKINSDTQLLTRTFYAPNGLVYRWKEGIGGIAYTNESLNPANVETVGVPNIAKDPFAGQDVMNVISLLVTGTPYNFRTYWRSVMEFDSFTNDSEANESPAHSYYSSLRESLSKQNVLWGNFIPFKSLNMDEASYKQMLNGLISINKTNSNIDTLLQKARDLQKKSQYFGAGAELRELGLNVIETSDKDKTNKELTLVTDQINNLIKEAKDKSKSDYAVDFLNSDPTEDPGFIDDSDGELSDLSRRTLRRKISQLTRRMSYNVRSNEDKNLFIVDDFYDKDYDLMAFTKDLENGIELYRNDFTNVYEKIIKAAEVLQLEIFCDTQGHIKVRPPQYNRMPSSVFYKMIEDKKQKGIQVFPQFLDDLFGNQIETLSERVEVVEDEIRLICAVAGINDDRECQAFINKETRGPGQFQFLSVDGNVIEFNILEQEETNNAGFVQSITNLFSTDNDNLNESVFLQTLQNQASTNRSQYSIHKRAQDALNAIEKHKLSESGFQINNNFAQQFASNSYIDKIITRIENKTGRKVNKYEYVIKNTVSGTIDVTPTEELDFLKLLDDLSKKVKERQKVVKLLSSAVKSAQEFKSLDEQPSDTRNKLLMPSVYDNENMPEVFEHMIEDEKYDDYGEGAGARFIIKDAQIINYNISEHPPDYTYVQVRGVLNPYNETLPEGFNNFPGNGNGLVTADAIDYDTWRMYGFTESSPITIPFFSNPQSQCLPYAAMMLSLARKNILQGTVTITGNEYMQQGEVIYLESRGLLFYVNSVRHNYTEGREFTTTLDLKYGHVPGEYIPVPLDIIGKMLYNNKDISSYVIQRQESSFNEDNIGVLVRDPNIDNSNEISEYKKQDSTYANFNSKTIANMLFTASKILNNNDKEGNNIKAVLELRIFNNNTFPINNNIKDFASSILSELTGDMTNSILNGAATTTAFKNHALDTKYIKIVEVNISASDDYRGASQKAISMARNIAEEKGPNITETGNAESYRKKNRVQQALFENIVDCVICFEQVNKEEANPVI